MENAFPSLTNAPLMLLTVIVLNVSRDMTSSTESVSSLLPTVLNLPISDVPLGTGTTKFVLSAQEDGSSSPTKFVSPFQINALPMLLMVIV